MFGDFPGIFSMTVPQLSRTLDGRVCLKRLDARISDSGLPMAGRRPIGQVDGSLLSCRNQASVYEVYQTIHRVSRLPCLVVSGSLIFALDGSW